MKDKKNICILVLAHQTSIKSYKKLDELSKVLECDIFCHIDRSAAIDLTKLQKEISTVKFIKKIDVCWSGRSMVDASMVLINNALEFDAYAKFLLISNDSKLLVTKHEFYKFCADYENMIEGNINDKYLSRSYKYNFFRNTKYSKLLFFRILSKILLFFGFFVKRKTDLDGSIKGSQWWMLSRKNIKKAVEFYKKKSTLLDFTNCADEFFFQNQVDKEDLSVTKEFRFMGTIFKERNSPAVLNSTQLQELRDKGFIFARKVIDA